MDLRRLYRTSVGPVLLVALVASGCGARPRAAPPPAVPSLIAYGHSFLAGVPGQAPAWPALLAGVLGRPLVNRSHGGNVIRDCRAQVDRADPPPGDADIVVFECDLNDVRRYGTDAAHLRYFTAQLRAALAAIRHGRVLVVEDPPILAWGLYAPFSHGSPAALQSYDQAIEASLRPGVEVVRVRGWDPATMIGTDGVHPNDNGELAISAAVAAVLRPQG